MTSVLTHSEALPKKLTEKDATKEEQYWSYFNGRHFTDVDISRPIIALARDIRDFYYHPFDPETHKYQMIGLGDSIHLATAIIFKADALHTRDKKASGGNLGLLGLGALTENGKIADQWSLRIIDPDDPDPELFDA